MNRTFHARVTIGQYLFLLLVTIVVVHEMWVKHALMAIIFMVLLVIVIERLIHTTYTLTTDGKLILFYGRFSRPKEILLSDIVSIERTSSMQIGRFALLRYLLLKYGERGKFVALFPVKEDLFISTFNEYSQKRF
ncbi:MAG: PH domain-containing protein [Bacteroides sp.]|nr:PH domain-containing protein [Bacteroides sp.]MCI1683749.1 PH domain-containing protein [Bacteroides sp.]